VTRSTFAAGRWWDIFFAATMLLLAVILLQDWPEVSVNRLGALITLGLISVAYALLCRPGRRNNRFAIALVVILIVGAAVATTFHPSMATIQVIAFPLIWSYVDDLRRGLVANAALAVVVGIALVISQGRGEAAILQAVTIEGISLVGSGALGIWFTRVEQLSMERQRLLDDLTAAQDQLAELHRDSGVTSERERLAREIHDTIAQSLTGIIMLSQQTQRELASGDVGALADQLSLLESRARDALVETRSLVAASAPVELGPGISAALERLAVRFARDTGVDVSVQIDDAAREPALLSRDIEVVLLRCAQESLANIRKHSRATSATMALTVTANEVVLTMSDNGVGFDPTDVSTGFGLSGMRDRLALAGGSLELVSSSHGAQVAEHVTTPGHGSVVRATLPTASSRTNPAPNGALSSPATAESTPGAMFRQGARS
jgi:signal transduction histidine kinase